MKAHWIFGTSLLMTLWLSCDCSYEATGVVIDQATGQPIAGATIHENDLETSLPTTTAGTTAHDGSFRLNKISANCDCFTWHYSHPNYEAKSIALKELSSDTLYLEPVQTTGIFNQEAPFELWGLKKSSDYPSSDTATSQCQSWFLTTNEIAEIIVQAKPITGYDWHYYFSHLPCQYTGQLTQGNQTLQFSLNSGAWFTLLSQDTLLRYGSYKEEYKAYFLSPAHTEDDFK